MQRDDLRHLLNLSYTELTNKGHCTGKLDLPDILCTTDLVPDYLALYDEPGYYQKTACTAVCFYRYDSTFDGMHGLFNAIYYNDEGLLGKFKERFKDVRLFIMPDNSQCGDIHAVENHYRLFKARVVSLWLTLELGAIVFPNLTYSREDEIDLAIDGFEQCTALALSLKGSLTDEAQAKLLVKALDRALARMPLKTLIVYTVSADDERILALLDAAVKANVRIVIPDNALRNHHRMQKKEL